MDSIQYISIDINNLKIQKNIYLKQYDIGRRIVFSVTENGTEKDIRGMSVMFKLRKPDGNFILDDIPIEGNNIILTTTDQMSVCAGLLPYQLTMYDNNGNLISTVTGYVNCEESVIRNEEWESSTEINFLAELLEEMAQIHDIAEMDRIALEVRDQANEVSDTSSIVKKDASDTKRYFELSKSYAVGGIGLYHDSGKVDDEDNSKYYYEKVVEHYNKLMTTTRIILPKANWDNNSQTVRVEGVTANEDEQLIVVRPKSTSAEEYAECNVMAARQGAGVLYFTCDLIPKEDLFVYVMVQTTSDFPINPSGTTLPQSSFGDDGMIYLQYDASGIQNVFGKVNGEWYVVSGGGSGYFILDTSSTDISEGIVSMDDIGVSSNYINPNDKIFEIAPEEWSTTGDDVIYIATRNCAVTYCIGSQSDYRDLSIYINSDSVIVDGTMSSVPTYVKGTINLKVGQRIGFRGYNTDWDIVKKNYMRVYSLIPVDTE